MWIDLGVSIGVTVSLGTVMYFQVQTRRKLKKLMGVLEDLQPVLQEFSENVDLQDAKIAEMKKNAQEYADQISSETEAAMKRVSLMSGIDTRSPAVFHGAKNVPSGQKDKLIKEIWKVG